MSDEAWRAKVAQKLEEAAAALREPEAKPGRSRNVILQALLGYGGEQYEDCVVLTPHGEWGVSGAYICTRRELIDALAEKEFPHTPARHGGRR